MDTLPENTQPMTEEEVIEARKTKQDIVMEVDEHCIVCNRRQDGDIAIVKIPEGVLFCLDCGEKHNDDNTYKGVDGGRAVYRIGFGFVEENK